MPLYDYSCQKGHTTERYMRRTLDVMECPVCGEPAERSPVSRPYITRFETGAIENMRLSTDTQEAFDHLTHRRYADKGGQL